MVYCIKLKLFLPLTSLNCMLFCLTGIASSTYETLLKKNLCVYIYTACVYINIYAYVYGISFFFFFSPLLFTRIFSAS